MREEQNRQEHQLKLANMRNRALNRVQMGDAAISSDDSVAGAAEQSQQQPLHPQQQLQLQPQAGRPRPQRPSPLAKPEMPQEIVIPDDVTVRQLAALLGVPSVFLCLDDVPGS